MLGFILYRLIWFYSLLVIAWCLMSWFPVSGGLLLDIKEVLGRLVSPYLDIFRKVIPPVGAIDFSPWVALVVLQIVGRFVLSL